MNCKDRAQREEQGQQNLAARTGSKEAHWKEAGEGSKLSGKRAGKEYRKRTEGTIEGLRRVQEGADA